MSFFKRIAESRIGTVAAIICSIALIAFLAIQLRGQFGQSEAGADTSLRWFVCSETGKGFQKRLDVGMTIPVLSPFSNKETGYPAELCFWNADGTIKEKPTPVLLSKYIGVDEPTFCPECGRLVVGHNPPPNAERPPPTREEWEQHHAASHDTE